MYYVTYVYESRLDDIIFVIGVIIPPYYYRNYRCMQKFARPQEQGHSGNPWMGMEAGGPTWYSGLGRKHKHGHGHGLLGRHGSRHAAAAANEDMEGRNSDPEGATEPLMGENYMQNFCPYKIGKRSMRNWSHCMQAKHARGSRKAEAYAHAAAAAAATKTSGQSRAGNSTETQPPFDLGVAAAQLQEFLNAFGKAYEHYYCF